jgi:hypothetical protein
MDPQVLAQVETKLTDLSSIYKVSITPQAAKILGECFTAIEADPHESWKLDPSRLKKFLSDMLNALPSTLANFANEQKMKEITSFDLLHGMTRIVDHMCPFTKPPP